MNLNIAILVLSGIAYFVLAMLSQPAIKNLEKKPERIIFLILGTALVTSPIWSPVASWLVWLLIGAIYSMAATLSYIGKVQWNVLWQDNVSNAAQMCMWLWDIAIALSAFTMM